jgi:flagellar biosynthesis protein FliQ
MTDDMVMKLAHEALITIAKLSGPILITTLGVGLLVSVFQALTQINEATLSFIPKIVIVGLIIALAGPWMLDIVTSYTTQLFEAIPDIVRAGQ